MAELGCWLSRDPDGYQYPSFNLYEYTGGYPLGRLDPEGTDWLDCMAECIEDNDPLTLALRAAVGALALSGGWHSKTVLAKVARLMRKEQLAKKILSTKQLKGSKSVSNLLSFISALKKTPGDGKIARNAWRTIGGKVSAVVGPIESLAAIETHCLGSCCTAAFYGIDYDPADGRIVDSIRKTYFSKWLR